MTTLVGSAFRGEPLPAPPPLSCPSPLVLCALCVSAFSSPILSFRAFPLLCVPTALRANSFSSLFTSDGLRFAP